MGVENTTRIDWVGEWRNEYGSRLTIRDDGDGRLAGTFETALGDSAFAGAELPILGMHRVQCAHFAFASRGEIHSICSFTGLLREGKLHMAWHVVSDQAVKPPRPGEPAQRMSLPWAHAVLTNSDTLVRKA
jgi:hypothetical protein